MTLDGALPPPVPRPSSTESRGSPGAPPTDRAPLNERVRSASVSSGLGASSAPAPVSDSVFQPSGSSTLSPDQVNKVNRTFAQAVKTRLSEEWETGKNDVKEFIEEKVSFWKGRWHSRPSYLGGRHREVMQETKENLVVRKKTAIDSATKAREEYDKTPNDQTAFELGYSLRVSERAVQVDKTFELAQEDYEKYGSKLTPHFITAAKEQHLNPFAMPRAITELGVKGGVSTTFNIGRYQEAFADPLIPFTPPFLAKTRMTSSPASDEPFQPSSINTKLIWSELRGIMEESDPKKRTAELAKYVEQFSDVNFAKNEPMLRQKYGIATGFEPEMLKKYHQETTGARSERRHIHAVLRQIIDDMKIDIPTGKPIVYRSSKPEDSAELTMKHLDVFGNTTSLMLTSPGGVMFTLKLEFTEKMSDEEKLEFFQDYAEKACALVDAIPQGRVTKKMTIFGMGTLQLDFSKEEMKRKKHKVNAERPLIKQILDPFQLFTGVEGAKRVDLGNHLRDLEVQLEQEKKGVLAKIRAGYQERTQKQDALEREYIDIDDRLRALRRAITFFGIQRPAPKVEVTSRDGAPPVDVAAAGGAPSVEITSDPGKGPPIDVSEQ